MSTSLAYWSITAWAQGGCCSSKPERQNEQQRTTPEISLPFTWEIKAFLVAFPSLLISLPLNVWQTVFLKDDHTNIFIPSHMFLLQCDRYSNWEVTFSSFESGRVCVKSRQSTPEVMPLDFWGSFHLGLSLKKIFKPKRPRWNHEWLFSLGPQ